MTKKLNTLGSKKNGGWSVNNSTGWIASNTTERFIYKGYVERDENNAGAHLLGKSINDINDKCYYLMVLNAPLDEDPEIGDEVVINYNKQLPYRKGQLLMGGAYIGKL